MDKIELGARLPLRPSRSLIHERLLPHIRRDIVLNRWAPGERLPEMELCREFGVSRTPLRDVLKLLEVEGLITLLPHVGAVVTHFAPPDLAEKLELMSGLEQIAAMKVARLRPEKTVRDIQRLHRSMMRAAKDKKIAQYYKLNDDFHRAIVLGANNKSLSDTHRTMMWHVIRARNRANVYETQDHADANHHSAIVKSIVNGDVQGASAAIRAHLDVVIANVLSGVRVSLSQAETTPGGFEEPDEPQRDDAPDDAVKNAGFSKTGNRLTVI